MNGGPAGRSPKAEGPRGWLRRRTGVEIAVGINLLAFAVTVILCNGFDWDAFFSFSEVDRRSWVLDHRAPLWSYQLCAGVTRIGDPQAFGLSPLFLTVILFGSFWGTKLAVLVSAAVGVTFTTKLLGLIADFEPRAQIPRAPRLTLATLFITSNYFLWHLLVGHFTFVSFFFGLGIIFYTLKGYLHGLRRRDFLIGSLVAWQHYSGGFFHSTIYLLLPFFAAFALCAAAAPWPWIRSATALTAPNTRRVVHATAFHLCGLLLASYKLIAVWQQQRLHPRVLEPANENNSLTQLLANQLFPTLGSEWLIPLKPEGQWAIHEFSAFSLVPIALLLLCFQLAFVRARERGIAARWPRHPLTGFVVAYALVSSTLALGTFSEFAPFSLLNSVLFQDSVRVASRFGVGVTLSLTLACALLLRRLAGRGLGEATCLLLLLLSLLNLSTFSWMLSAPRTLWLASLPSDSHREMSILMTIPRQYAERGRELDRTITSEMYAFLRRGIGVINCYNEIPRPPPLEGWAPQRVHEIIDARFGSPGRQCVEQSFYTQNEIQIAASCPQRVCLNVDALNERDRPAGVRRLPRQQRFCRVAEP